MSRPSRRSSPRRVVREALLAGAVSGGVFLSLLGAMRAALRLGILPRHELALLLPLALVIVLLPLAAGLKLGFHDDTPPALRAYRHALPWSRSPTEELTGSVLGGAFWAVVGLALAMLAEQFAVVGAGAIVAALFGPALAAASLVTVHGRRWRTGRAVAVLVGVVLLLAAPQLALGPRGPLGGSHALGLLAREHADLAARSGRPGLLREAYRLAYEGCNRSDARSCLLASFYAPPDAPADLLDDLTRRGCDLTTTDLASCGRLIGPVFQAAPGAASACSVDERCTASHGLDCRAGLLACKRALAPAALLPVCARRDASGWREVWCALPVADPDPRR